MEVQNFYFQRIVEQLVFELSFNSLSGVLSHSKVKNEKSWYYLLENNGISEHKCHLLTSLCTHSGKLIFNKAL